VIHPTREQIDWWLICAEFPPFGLMDHSLPEQFCKFADLAYAAGFEAGTKQEREECAGLMHLNRYYSMEKAIRARDGLK